MNIENLAYDKYPEEMREVWTEEGLAFMEDIHEDVRIGFIEGYKAALEELRVYAGDEDNYTEGELGNSCIDASSILYFIKSLQ